MITQINSSHATAAGCLGTHVHPDAIEALATFTRGLPRKIDQLAEKSLILGCQKESRAISSEIVQLAQEEIDFIRTA